MKTSLTKFSKKAKLVKKSDRHEVYDLTLESLVLSMTVLHRDKSTTGHSHDDTDTEEIYLFIGGKGEIYLDNEKKDVVSGDIVIIIPPRVFLVFLMQVMVISLSCASSKNILAAENKWQDESQVRRRLLSSAVAKQLLPEANRPIFLHFGPD